MARARPAARSRLAMAAVLLLVACAAGTPRRIACLGDSNTAADWPEAGDQRWCELLGDFPEFAGTRIDNFARGGAQLRGPGVRWSHGDVQLAWAADAGRPDVIVLAFGTNDLRNGGSRRAVARRYQALRRRAEVGGAIVYVALTPPMWLEPADAAMARKVDALNAMLRQSWPGARVLDFHDPFTRDDFEADGLHLNAGGQRKRAEIARRVLRTPVAG